MQGHLFALGGSKPTEFEVADGPFDEDELTPEVAVISRGKAAVGIATLPKH